MEFANYIEPGLAVLIPALYLLGTFIKNSSAVADKHIPLILCAAGVFLAGIWLVAALDMPNRQSVLSAVFAAFVQGVLCAGAAVLTNQIIKQEREG